MARPTLYPEWASGASASIIEPPAGKKVAGWLPKERPPAQYMNWILKRIKDWIEWSYESEIIMPACSAELLDPTLSAYSTAGYIGSKLAGSVYGGFPIILPVGYTIGNIVYYAKEPDAVGEVIKTPGMSRFNLSTGVGSIIGSSAKTSGYSGTYATWDYTGDGEFPYTIEDGYSYFLPFQMQATTADDEARLFAVKIVPEL